MRWWCYLQVNAESYPTIHKVKLFKNKSGEVWQGYSTDGYPVANFEKPASVLPTTLYFESIRNFYICSMILYFNFYLISIYYIN